MLKNMKIGTKIGGGFIVILFLTAFIAFVSWGGLHGVVDRAQKSDDTSLLAQQIKTIRQHEKNFLIRNDKKYADQVVQVAEEMKAEALKLKSRFPLLSSMIEVIGALGRLYSSSKLTAFSFFR